MKPIIEAHKVIYPVKNRAGERREFTLDLIVVNYVPRKPRLKYGLRMLGSMAALLLVTACAGSAPLDKFNSGINSQIQYAADAGRDHWQTPEETARLGHGDCEDYAILKMARLPEGYAGNLVLVTEISTQQAHMILRAKNLKTGEVVFLDNLRDPVPEEKFSFYYDHIKTMPAGATTRHEMVYGSASE